jgi:hypothetical protein
VVLLFIVGTIFGSAWAKTYLIPKYFPSLVAGQAQVAINSEAKEAAHV